MINASQNLEMPVNEPVREYRPNAPETKSLQATIDQMAANPIEIPCIVGGEEIFTGKVEEVRCPHDHSKVLAKWHAVTPDVLDGAIAASQRAWRSWSEMEMHPRISVFLKMADLLAGPWRDTINASTMLGQSKTCHQAEIDAAAEMIDFFRYNAYFAMNTVYAEQPASQPGMWNYLDHRPLEGFVYAISPFNFTSIGGNLPTAPAMMGNVAMWKPSRTALLSNYYVMKLFMEAGLPAGVINFLPGSGRVISGKLLEQPDFAGLHFTGSTGVFQSLWKQISDHLPHYNGYPRIVGETGGKDFIFAHASSNVEALVAAAIRGAYEYQGQKCSAASRMYVPKSIWPAFRDRFVDEVKTIRMGDTRDFSNFMGAVIDEASFDNIKGYIDHAKASNDADVFCGGECDRSTGWFVQPTAIQCKDPNFKSMREEIFGPVLSIFVYDDNELDETLELCDKTSPYALTGAIWGQDRHVLNYMAKRLRHAAGNFYINDKPTGAVVGQQPFGGARASGTDDKAGSALNLIRWVAPRTVKETFAPPTDYRYPFLG